MRRLVVTCSLPHSSHLSFTTRRIRSENHSVFSLVMEPLGNPINPALPRTYLREAASGGRAEDRSQTACPMELWFPFDRWQSSSIGSLSGKEFWPRKLKLRFAGVGAF